MPRTKVRDQDGIYQRKDSPFWWACLPREQGGSTRRSTGIPIAEDPQGLKAVAVRAQWRAEGHTQRTGEGATFDDLMLAYLPIVTARAPQPRRYRYAAKALYPHFTGRLLADIGAHEVRAYIASRQDQGRQPGCINKEIALMSGAYRWANEELEWAIPANPWRSRFLREPAGRTRFLSQDEASALLAAADGLKRAPHLGDLIRCMLATGIRPGEALGLEWGRVDLSRRIISFQIGDQKNGKAGTIPMNDAARAALLSGGTAGGLYIRGRDAVSGEMGKGFASARRGGWRDERHPTMGIRGEGWRAGERGEGRGGECRRRDAAPTSGGWRGCLGPWACRTWGAALDQYQLSRSVSRSAPEEREAPAKEQAG